MTTVTNATVEYSRMTRPGDFEHRNPKVSFSIQFDDGDDYLGLTRQIMHDAVSLAEEAATGKITLAEVATAVVQTERPRRGRPAKATEAPKPDVDTDHVLDRGAHELADDMGVGPTPAGPEPQAEPSLASATSVVEEISDKQLQAAVAPVSQKMREQTARADGGSGNINALVTTIHEFAGGWKAGEPEPGLSKIPQKDRPAFLVAIKALVQPQAQSVDGIPL